MKPVIRTLYASICFLGCLAMALPPATWVYAAGTQAVSQMEFSQSPLDRVEAKEKEDKREIDDHLGSTDLRVNQISDQVSFIKGGCSSAFALLGALQILGMIKEKKKGNTP